MKRMPARKCLEQPDDSRGFERGDADIMIGETHQQAQENERKTEERFTAVELRALFQFERAAFGKKNQPANSDNQQRIGVGMRNMPHKTVDPYENLQIGYRENRGNEPWDPLFFCHFAGESFARELDEGRSRDHKADVEARAEDD